jgi:hypothetical protein
MKFFHVFWLLLAFSAPLLAQNYQYQYPYDPYNSSPKPQPSGYGPADGGGGDYAFDKLLSYSSFTANYAYNDFKGLDGLSNTSGFNLGLNVALFKPLYLHFGVDWLSGTDEQSHDYSLTGLSAGAGVYVPIVSRFHLFGEVGLRYDTTSGVLDALNHDDFAVYLRPGIRVAVTDRFELAASVYFSTTDNLDDRAVQINGYYNLFSIVDVNLGVDFGSDVNTYHGGVRLRW